jgi:hypothetical protein
VGRGRPSGRAVVVAERAAETCGDDVTTSPVAAPVLTVAQPVQVLIGPHASRANRESSHLGATRGANSRRAGWLSDAER